MKGLLFFIFVLFLSGINLSAGGGSVCSFSGQGGHALSGVEFVPWRDKDGNCEPSDEDIF